MFPADIARMIEMCRYSAGLILVYKITPTPKDKTKWEEELSALSCSKKLISRSFWKAFDI